MTQKDYIKIAAILKVHRKRVTSDDTLLGVVLKDITFDFAFMLAEDNPRFDRDKFFKAAHE